MDEEDKELEAIKEETQRHRDAAEKALAQANILSAYETVNQRNWEKKAEKKKARESVRKKQNRDKS